MVAVLGFAGAVVAFRQSLWKLPEQLGLMSAMSNSRTASDRGGVIFKNDYGTGRYGWKGTILLSRL